ncbi:MAG: HDOD domain-containing protein [Deltaproteobacteria bacterium]|nr:HDOD domain-containing protein [Deltaproteobacteria bacterium]
MKRVLFVDDEPLILRGLKRMLFCLADEWEMDFVESAEEAIALLDGEPYDVLVTDMRMPHGMDGAALLAWSKEHHPGVVRIILSGYADDAASLRAVSVAHQFLSKPSSSARIREVVDRACDLRDMLAETTLRERVGSLDALPPLPQTYQRLSVMLANNDVSLREIGAIVGEDPALSAKVLQIVNSAFFGIPRHVTNIERAVSFVGANMLRNLVLAAEVFSCFGDVSAVDVAAEQAHGLAVARLAREIADPEERDEAFMAGLLHDIGRLVLALVAPGDLAEIEALRRKDGQGGRDLEIARGLRHDHVGAYLLGIWGLPFPLVEAVAFHHEPQRVEMGRFDLLAVIHVADALVRDIDDADLSPFLEKLGRADRLPEWRILAGSS